MTFDSINFWIVFPFIFGFYWLIPAKKSTIRKVFLIAVSYLLYMAWNPAWALALFSISILTYLGGFLVGTLGLLKKQRTWAWILTLLSLTPLLFFKYYTFLNHYIQKGLSFAGFSFSMPGLNYAVPVGISFFTFQAVGYLLDVYHKKTVVEKNILDYLLFVSFFPQISAGPISSPQQLLPQIKSNHTFDYEMAKQGLMYVLWGLFMKVVIADRLGIIVDYVFATYPTFSGGACLLTCLFFSLQIYCDFAGYSLMAIGIARTIGFKLPDNFKRPYLAFSLTDFWHRWHITLTQWFTRQVYIPLGGNRRGKGRTYLNIFITFLLSGIWHGANLTFIVWGAIHGVLLVVEKACGLHKIERNGFGIKLLRTIATFIVVSFTWIFFRAPGLPTAAKFIAHIFSFSPGLAIHAIDTTTLFIAILGAVLLLIKDFKDEFFYGRLSFFKCRAFQWAFYIVLLCMIVNMGVLDGGQFIYMGF